MPSVRRASSAIRVAHPSLVHHIARVRERTSDEAPSSPPLHWTPALNCALRGSFSERPIARIERSVALKNFLEVRNSVQESSVMEEMTEPRPTFVLARGRYDAQKPDAQRVGRSPPASLTAFPANAPTNRLGLAQWLTDPHHPLTARVAVNRSEDHTSE